MAPVLLVEKVIGVSISRKASRQPSVRSLRPPLVYFPRISARQGKLGRIYASMHVCIYACMVITYSKSKDRPGKVANPARG